MKQLARVALVVLALLALPGLARAEGAEPVSIVQTLPFDTVVDDPCSGEAVVVSGEAHFVFHQSTDATGGLHDVAVSSLIGVTGTSATDVEYRFQQVSVNELNEPRGHGASPQEPGLEFSQVQRTRVVTAAASDNFLANFLFHVTVNANGEPTAVFERVDARCVG